MSTIHHGAWRVETPCSQHDVDKKSEHTPSVWRALLELRFEGSSILPSPLSWMTTSTLRLRFVLCPPFPVGYFLWYCTCELEK